MRIQSIVALGVLTCAVAIARAEQPAKDAYLEKFHPAQAPAPVKHFLKTGDKLAICGDSITEQKMYSRIMETYLTVCAPELKISVRQYGWGGEQALGFLARMTNDCLRFNPTVETTCYGMNDHKYRAYEDSIGQAYRSNSTAIVESFKAHHVRVMQGSPGCVGKRPGWSTDTNATMDTLNLNLCELRNIGVDIARKEKTGFADVFWPMLVEGHEAQLKYGPSYGIAGGDGVHPGWAGHLVMAYAFLHSFGLDGDIGTFTVDPSAKRAKVSKGHHLETFDGTELKITSYRYPFCIGDGDPASDNNIRSGTMLVPFNQELNRLTLVVKHPKAAKYKITWGEVSHTFDAEQLSKGINLAEQFPVNPFTAAFKKVDEAVAAKQAYETTQVKSVFHGQEGKTNMEAAVARTEKERAPLVAAIHDAFVPVTHTIKIEAE